MFQQRSDSRENITSLTVAPDHWREAVTDTDLIATAEVISELMRAKYELRCELAARKWQPHAQLWLTLCSQRVADSDLH